MFNQTTNIYWGVAAAGVYTTTRRDGGNGSSSNDQDYSTDEHMIKTETQSYVYIEDLRRQIKELRFS